MLLEDGLELVGVTPRDRFDDLAQDRPSKAKRPALRGAESPPAHEHCRPPQVIVVERAKVRGEDPGLLARRGRRGGLIGSILSDVYFGITPRPLTELAVTVEAMRRGIPVAEPMGAMIEWLSPVLYRGFFLTRAVRGMTLWEFLKTDDDPTVRTHVLGQARAAIETMHDKGLFHADLNLHNLLVTQTRDSFSVVVIDLDKSRLFDAPLSAAMRHANAARLMRSARKLDPSGKFLDAAALSILSLE